MGILTKKLESLIDHTVLTEDVFTDLNKDRRQWEPANLPANEPYTQSVPGIENCFKRIVALGLELELPVGSFIRAAIEKIDDIPPTAIKGMVENIKDEEKHFAVFQNIAKVFTPSNFALADTTKFRKILLHFSHNPIGKARDVETIIFLPIQGILRVYGGEALERSIADISHDEFRHTNYGWELSSVLKIDRDQYFEGICLDIVKWCVQPLANEIGDMWVGIAEEMQEEGYSERLDQMLNYGIHKAPFEISNSYY